MPEDAPLWMWLVPAFSTLVGVLAGGLLQYFTATKQIRADAERARELDANEREREEREARRARIQMLAEEASRFIPTVMEMHRIRLTLDDGEPVLIDGAIVDGGQAVLRRDQLTAECWGWMMTFTASDAELGLRARRILNSPDKVALERRVMSFRQRLAVISD